MWVYLLVDNLKNSVDTQVSRHMVLQTEERLSAPVVPKMCSADYKESTTSLENPWIYFCNCYFEVY